MKVIYGGRQTGRTTRLIQLCAETEAKGEISYIVCSTPDEAYRIAESAKELDLKIGFPITYDEFLQGDNRGIFIKHLFIDNAEMFLSYLSPIHIEAIVMEKK